MLHLHLILIEAIYLDLTVQPKSVFKSSMTFLVVQMPAMIEWSNVMIVTLKYDHYSL